MKSEKLSYLHPYSQEDIHPGFSLDCVLLAYHKKRLRVLLIKYNYSIFWQLPGGFMLKTENAEEAAVRILQNYTHLDNIYLRQFHLFSDIDRVKQDENILFVGKNRDGTRSNRNEEWFLQRYVSLGFYAFVKFEDVELLSNSLYIYKWMDVEDLPKLYADHNHIVSKAIDHIKLLVPILPIATELMPDKFRMSDLRRVFEAIGRKKLDRRNFQKKIIGTGMVTMHNKSADDTAYNPANLYSLSDRYAEHIFDLSKLLK